MDGGTSFSIFRHIMRPMRLLMYAFAALPYECNAQHSNAFKGGISWLLIVWRLLHQILSIAFVTWISMLRWRKYHEVLYRPTDIFSNSVDMVSYGTLIAVYLIVYWENTWKAHHYQPIFDNFELIRMKFRLLLKTDIPCRRLCFYAMILYALLAAYLGIIFLVIYIRYTKALNATRLLVSQYCDIILKLKLIEFALFVVIVMVMQMKLNAFSAQFLARKVPRLLVVSSNGAEKDDILNTFGVLQDIHKLLVLNVGYMENYFLWSLPGLLLKMFFEMIYTSYWIYFSADFKMSGYFRLYGISTIILQPILLFITCLVCSKSEMLDRKFSNIFHNTALERHSRITRSQLSEISLQLLHEKIIFTAGGFVDVNCSFFGKFVFSVVCYIVILIQFHMSV